jgi:hypothetical protein
MNINSQTAASKCRYVYIPETMHLCWDSNPRCSVLNTEALTTKVRRQGSGQFILWKYFINGKHRECLRKADSFTQPKWKKYVIEVLKSWTKVFFCQIQQAYAARIWMSLKVTFMHMTALMQDNVLSHQKTKPETWSKLYSIVPQRACRLFPAMCRIINPQIQLNCTEYLTKNIARHPTLIPACMYMYFWINYCVYILHAQPGKKFSQKTNGFVHY